MHLDLEQTIDPAIITKLVKICKLCCHKHGTDSPLLIEHFLLVHALQLLQFLPDLQL
jgi:hypothetical protein